MHVARPLAIGALAGIGVRQAIGVRRVRRSKAEYREHWQSLAASHASDTDALRYVALGDSVAQGIGASTPAKGYVPQVADRVAELAGREVAVYNLSVTGARAIDLLEDQIPRLAELGFAPDIVTVEVGANDTFDLGITVEDFTATMAQVLAELPPGCFVSDAPAFFVPPFRARSEAMAAAMRPLIPAAGHHLVDLYRASTAGGQAVRLWQSADDVFHPNDRGYERWARVFLEAILASGAIDDHPTEAATIR